MPFPFRKSCLPVMLAAATLLAPMAGATPALAQNSNASSAQKAPTKRALADAVADRLYRNSVEYEIYLAFWPAIEKQFKEVKPDIPTWDLAKSQVIARRLAGHVYDRAKTPLLESIEKTFSEKEMKAILDVPRSDDQAVEAFGNSELGRKVSTEGSKAASAALNGEMLKLVQAEGESYAVEVIREAIEEGILPPPPESATPLPPSYGPVSPIPPIPITPPRR